MGRATDQAGIHFRILNASKGRQFEPLGRKRRALYKNAVRDILEHQPNLSLFQQSVVDLVVEADKVVGCETQMGLVFRATSVVLTTGTFWVEKSTLDTNSKRAAELATHRRMRWLSGSEPCRSVLGA